jgi:RecT family
MNEINKIRSMSRARSDDAPWKQWPAEMMKKTAIRRLSKLLPSGRDLIPDEDEEPSAVEPAAPVAEIKRPSSAAAALEQFAGGKPDKPEPQDTGESPRTDEDEGQPPGGAREESVDEAFDPPGAIALTNNDDESPNWDGWVWAFSQSINKTTSVAQLEALVNVNGPMLSELKLEDAKTHTRIIAVISRHKQTLGKPTKGPKS